MLKTAQLIYKHAVTCIRTQRLRHLLTTFGTKMAPSDNFLCGSGTFCQLLVQRWHLPTTFRVAATSCNIIRCSGSTFCQLPVSLQHSLTTSGASMTPSENFCCGSGTLCQPLVRQRHLPSAFGHRSVDLTIFYDAWLNITFFLTIHPACCSITGNRW